MVGRRRGSDPADLEVRPITVQAQTVAKLRDAILGGVFQPGQRLVEVDLCRRMAVSRTSVREALRRLEAERLVTVQPNRGPSVTEISWDEARQIYDVRAMLEGEAAALFATRAAPPALEQLERALVEFDRAVAANDPLERLGATQRFYDVILEGCGNAVIAELLRGLVARITFLRARSMSRPGRSRVSAIEMRRMFEAIRAGNARAARAAAIRHVRAAAAAARLVFDGQGERRPPAGGRPRGSGVARDPEGVARNRRPGPGAATGARRGARAGSRSGG